MLFLLTLGAIVSTAGFVLLRQFVRDPDLAAGPEARR